MSENFFQPSRPTGVRHCMDHSFRDVRRILVIKLRHIGDVLLTAPVYKALRETFPDAAVSALVNSGTSGVLEGNPYLDRIIVLDRKVKELPLRMKGAAELGFLKMIRKEAFDMTVDLTGGDRAAIISLFSGARYRLGPALNEGFFGKKYLYTHRAALDGRRHTVLQNLDVVRAWGINALTPSVDVYPPEESFCRVKGILRDAGFTGNAPLVHVHPTSRWLFKCWSDESVAEVVRWLSGRGTTAVVTSSPEPYEVGKARRILSLASGMGECSGIIDLTGKTTLAELGAISYCADLFFGVDSAPMHIAASVGTPVVALFGPSGAFHWGPWDNEKIERVPYPKKNGIQEFGAHTVIQRGWDCVPCGKDGCDGSKKSRCLEDISPGEVKAVLDEKLKSLQVTFGKRRR